MMKITKTIILSICLAVSSLSLNAHAQMCASILTAPSLSWPTCELSTDILKSTSIG
jgi:hypothetical protein